MIGKYKRQRMELVNSEGKQTMGEIFEEKMAVIFQKS